MPTTKAPGPVPRATVHPGKPPPPRDERLAALLEQGDLLARYLDAHGAWETHTHRGDGRTTTARVFTPCGCAVCADALRHLDLED